MVNTSTVDRRKIHYKVNTVRDTKLMKSFINFKNRVQHPTVTPGILLIGATFVLLPFVRPEIRTEIGNAGTVISVLIGALMMLLGVGRQYITIALMKKNPENILGEEIVYLFGNDDIRAKKKASEERVGFYKNVYSLWEDENTFYIGLDNDELIILPKSAFMEGNVEAFKLFVIEKSNAKYIWSPKKWKNKQKAKMVRRQMNQNTENEQ